MNFVAVCVGQWSNARVYLMIFSYLFLNAGQRFHDSFFLPVLNLSYRQSGQSCFIKQWRKRQFNISKTTTKKRTNNLKKSFAFLDFFHGFTLAARYAVSEVK